MELGYGALRCAGGERACAQAGAGVYVYMRLFEFRFSNFEFRILNFQSRIIATLPLIRSENNSTIINASGASGEGSSFIFPPQPMH